MKIICKNCGWSWNRNDGGVNPCKCHKCGYNNKDMYGKKIVGLGGVSEFITVETLNGEKKVIKDGKKFNVMVSHVGGSSWKFSKPTSKKEAIKLLNMIAKDKAKRTGQI